MSNKIWYSLCIIFCISNLITLLDDLGQVTYTMVEEGDDLYDDFTNYLVCTSFSDISKRNHLQFSSPKNVTIREFLNASIMSIKHRMNVSNLFRLDKSFVFKDTVCFQIEKNDLEKVLSSNFLKNYRIKLFMYSNGKLPFIYDYVFYKAEKTQWISLNVHKQKVFKKEFLRNEDKCLNAKDQLKFGRFQCINECFVKRGAKLSFHTHDSNAMFDLKLIANKKDQKRIKRDISFVKIETLFNRSHINFITCLKKCNKTVDCFYETTNVVRLTRRYFETLSTFAENSKIKVTSTIYKAYYSTDDFYLQLFGLLTLFTGTSVIETIPEIVRIVSRRLNLHSTPYYNLIYRKFKFYLTAFSLVFVLLQSSFMIKEYKFRSLYPNKTSTLTFEFDPKPFYLVLCFPIEIIIDKKNETEFGRNEQLITKYTFYELEEKTRSGFEDKVKSVAILHGLDIREQDLKVDGKVLFKKQKINNENLLLRCFQKEIAYQEYRFKTLMPINNLIVHFRTRYWTAYLIEKHQRFTSGLFKIKGEFYVSKKLKKNSKESRKSKCEDYEEKMKNCTSRNNCLDLCITTEFRDKHKNLTIYSVVDQDDLNDTKSIYFVDKKDKEIEDRCHERFKNWDCVNAYFSNTMKTSYRYNETKLTINLNFEKLKAKENEPSFVKMILNIINLESVFFGSTISSILTTFFILISKRLEFLRLENLQKILKTRILVLTFCFTGFFIHNLNVFNSIINNELIDSGFFSSMDKLYLPKSILCFEIENYEHIDKNHKLTGNYLDKFTSKNMNYDNVFGYVWYFNKTHRLGFKVSKEKNYNKEILIHHFYYLNLKCFEISLMLELEETDFYLLDTRNVLGVYLNSDFANRTGYVYFLFREKRKRKQFSNSFFFRIKNDDNLEFEGFNYTYEIHFEQFEILHKDHFETLKDLKSLFYKEKISINDATVYLDSLASSFEEQFNKTTKEVILESKAEKKFEMEIDDDLFLQYYLQVQNVSDYNNPKTNASDQHIYNIYVQHGLNEYKSPGFVFSISLLKRMTEISNEDNYTKVIQSVLNTLSLWLHICILDVVIFIRKVQIIFIKFYGILKKMRIKLYFLLLSR